MQKNFTVVPLKNQHNETYAYVDLKRLDFYYSDPEYSKVYHKIQVNNLVNT
jgi:hypothetical protein